MPLTHTVHPELGLIVIIGTGRISGADAAQVRAEMLDDPLFDPTFHRLNDYRLATGGESGSPGGAATQAMAVSSGDAMQSVGKTAIVAPASLVFGLSRMFQAYAEAHTSGVRTWQTFRNIEDAAAWLGFDTVPECLREVPAEAAEDTKT